MKKRMAKMVPVLCVAAMVGLTACSSAKPAETKAPETKAEAASEKEPAGEEPAAAVDFPKDTLNIICHAAAGGGSDALARQVAQGLQDGNGWTVTVDNKTGGSGSVGMQFVMNSKPDGYTIGTAPVELSMIEALGYAQLAPEDVQLLGCGMSWPAALYVPADAPYDTLEDFINYCTENPGKVRVANSGRESRLTMCRMTELPVRLRRCWAKRSMLLWSVPVRDIPMWNREILNVLLPSARREAPFFLMHRRPWNRAMTSM